MFAKKTADRFEIIRYISHKYSKMSNRQLTTNIYLHHRIDDNLEIMLILHNEIRAMVYSILHKYPFFAPLHAAESRKTSDQ